MGAGADRLQGRPLEREGFFVALKRFPAFVLVAERDAQRLAHIRASVHQAASVAVLSAEGACIEIEDLYAQPDAWEGGVGHLLLEQLLVVARQVDVRRVVVGTLSTQTDKSLRFYRRHSFTLWQIQFFLQDDQPS